MKSLLRIIIRTKIDDDDDDDDDALDDDDDDDDDGSTFSKVASPKSIVLPDCFCRHRSN